MEDVSLERKSLNTGEYEAIVASIEELCVVHDAPGVDGIVWDRVRIDIPEDKQDKFDGAYELHVRKLSDDTETPEYLLAFHVAGDKLDARPDAAYLGYYCLVRDGQLYEASQVSLYDEAGMAAKDDYIHKHSILVGANGRQSLSDIDLQQRQIKQAIAQGANYISNLSDVLESESVDDTTKRQEALRVRGAMDQLEASDIISFQDVFSPRQVLQAALQYAEYRVGGMRKMTKIIDEVIDTRDEMTLVESPQTVAELRQALMRAVDLPRTLVI